VSWYHKGKNNLEFWILLKQETVSGSGISWATRQHPTTQFLQAGCPSCCPTNSIKALKAKVNPFNTHNAKLESVQ